MFASKDDSRLALDDQGIFTKITIFKFKMITILAQELCESKNSDILMSNGECTIISHIMIIIPAVAPLYIPLYKSQEFNVLYAKFAKMFSSAYKVISKCSLSLKAFKTFIQDFNSDLEAELSVIDNLQGVMCLIRKNCGLINIVILEAGVEHFEINDAQKCIDDYKREIDELCQSLPVDLCLNEPFDVVRASPPLECETVTYVLRWEATEYKLKDVTNIVSKSSGNFVKIVKISCESTQSITITCSFPHSFTGGLIIKLSDNLELLIKNGLMKLTVGYCTIWEKQVPVCVTRCQ